MKQQKQKQLRIYHRGITRMLLGKYPMDASRPEVRQRLNTSVGMLSIILNALLSLGKGWVGLAAGSLAVLADAIHSLSDVASSIILVIGMRLSRRPRDRNHPFGYGRAEFITALVMAIILIVAAIELVQSGVQRILRPEPVVVSRVLIMVLLVSVLLKEWLAIFTLAVSRWVQSTALQADGWHHRTDSISTLVVLLSTWAASRGWYTYDGWATLLVGLFVFYMGVRIAMDAVRPLLGEAPDQAMLEGIRARGLAVDGVHDVHDIIVHQYGELKLVSLHIEVDAGLNALDIHDLSETVESSVESVGSFQAVVHVDPVDRSHPDYKEAERAMHAIVQELPAVQSYHDLRVESGRAGPEISVDVVMEPSIRTPNEHEIRVSVEAAVSAKIPSAEGLHVNVEKGYDLPHEKK